MSKNEFGIDQLYDYTSEVLEIAHKLWPSLKSKLSGVDVEFFDNELLSAKVCLITSTIKYNKTFLIENGENFKSTVLHEISHLVVYNIFGNVKRLHGKEFKAIISKLAFRMDIKNFGTYHSYSIESLNLKNKFQYSCVCGKSYVVGLNVHKKIQGGEIRVCKCKRDIVASNLKSINQSEV